MNTVSGNYDTKEREIWVVKKLLDQAHVPYASVEKYDLADDADILVVLRNGRRILIEVKEEENERFNTFHDWGLDYISAFRFKPTVPADKWKRVRSPRELQAFLDDIDMSDSFKWGKLEYSKADLWLFFTADSNGNIVRHAFFPGSYMTSEPFKQYVYTHCQFAVNNKPAWQRSYYDRHKSAVFFMKYNHPKLTPFQVDISTYMQ